MNNNFDKYLPIGSVVMLKNGKKRIMVTGYAPIDMEKKDQVYDYMGCMFPEGVISTDKNLLFNHEDISQIYCIGYKDNEQEEFLKRLKSILTKENVSAMLEKAKATATVESKN